MPLESTIYPISDLMNLDRNEPKIQFFIEVILRTLGIFLSKNIMSVS